MLKYQFMQYVKVIQQYNGFLALAVKAISNAEFISHHTIDFDAKTLFIKIYTKNKKRIIHLYFNPTGFHLDIYDKDSKEKIDNVQHNYTNYQETNMTAIFTRKIMKLIQDIAESK